MDRRSSPIAWPALILASLLPVFLITTQTPKALGAQIGRPPAEVKPAPVKRPP